MQLKRLTATRDHIAHIIPELTLSGCLCLATKIAHELRRQYQHTLVFETPLMQAQPELYYNAQNAGLDVVQADEITPEVLESSGFTGAILYNVAGAQYNGLGQILPSIYYSYGVYDAGVGGWPVSCSEYACKVRRTGPGTVHLDPDLVIPPMVSTREWRRVRGTKHPFTVGILTSGAYDKYPCRVVMELLGKMPKDVTLLITKLPRYKHMGMQLALDARKEECRNTFTCDPTIGATLKYLVSCDALIFASDDEHYEPYGRMVVEAMALGKPVICENRGVFATTLEHTVNSFLFNNTDEIIEHVNRIRRDQSMVELLGANARLNSKVSWGRLVRPGLVGS